MTKMDLLRAVAFEHEITIEKANTLLSDVLDTIAQQTIREGRFAWPGFGVFTLTKRKARNIRNPQTNEIMRLPATKSIRFHPAKALHVALGRAQ